jgi:hypothetical protein
MQPTLPGQPQTSRVRGSDGTVTALLVIGAVIALLVAALGAYLLASGHAVIGILLLAIGGLRLVMTVLRARRRHHRRDRIEAWRARRFGSPSGDSG